MNPDTKLTVEQIKDICLRHGIMYKHHSRITTGFSHEVHRLNDDLLIKIFNYHDKRLFQTEVSALASDLSFKKPEYITSSEHSEDIDRSYIIMKYVPGKPLGSCWHQATDEQREKLIEEICASLKVINQTNPHALGLTSSHSWREQVAIRGRDSILKLEEKKIIDKTKAGQVITLLEQNSMVLSDSKLKPVYWDIHFDNFIVNDKYELQAIIDLENIELTSIDYPVFVIQKQTDEPEKYLREEDEQYADKRDYAKLKGWYMKYYPEMFALENLDTRLKLYQLLDVLHLLTDWPQVQELYRKLDILIKDLSSRN